MLSQSKAEQGKTKRTGHPKEASNEKQSEASQCGIEQSNTRQCEAKPKQVLKIKLKNYMTFI